MPRAEEADEEAQYSTRVPMPPEASPDSLEAGEPASEDDPRAGGDAKESK
jgi:hypothetical protein